MHLFFKISVQGLFHIKCRRFEESWAFQRGISDLRSNFSAKTRRKACGSAGHSRTKSHWTRLQTQKTTIGCDWYGMCQSRRSCPTEATLQSVRNRDTPFPHERKCSENRLIQVAVAQLSIEYTHNIDPNHPIAPFNYGQLCKKCAAGQGNLGA